jgi:putative acetyltransferase
MSVSDAEIWAKNLSVLGMELKIREMEILVAEINRQVVGWGAIRGDQLEGLYTDPGFAGRGIGTELLNKLEVLMRTYGIRTIRVEASLNAEGFYLRRGYERLGPPLGAGRQIIKRLT